MTPAVILACVGAYFALLLAIAWRTGRGADTAGYYLGNKASPWYIVAFGMISDTLSGVTFISVPGSVGANQFSYLQMVFGYVLGYVAIALVLLPLYYRLELTSIYGYLGQRFGPRAQKTGAAFFLLSRTLGAAARLYLAAGVFQTFVFDQWHVPFALTVAVMILLMLAYTYRGGIKTLVWTDTLQSAFLLLGVGLSLVALWRGLGLDWDGLVSTLQDSPHAQIFFWDWKDPKFFWKQFLSGAFIAVVMTGLDQNSMQKSLSCRTLGEAQKNIFWFSGVIVLVNFLFLALGALLYAYAQSKGVDVPEKTDQFFPLLAFQHLGTFAAVVFVLGLTAATFSSADSVLTTLTTSFCLDIAHDNRRSEAERTRLRHRAHIGFAVLLLLVILVFQAVSSRAVIDLVLKLATFTYGPLLGLFALGLFTRCQVSDRLAPLACVLAPMICWVLERNAAAWFGGYKFGYELLLVNGALTAALLYGFTRLTGTASETEMAQRQ